MSEQIDLPVLTQAELDQWPAPIGQPELDPQQEWLKNIAKEAGVFAYGWINGREVRDDKQEKQMGFHGVYNDRRMDFENHRDMQYLKLASSDKLKSRLMAEGATELVHAYRSSLPMSEFKTSSTHSTESVIAICYETTTGSRDRDLLGEAKERAHQYQMAQRTAGAEDPQLLVQINLPESIGIEFIHKARTNPVLYRELVDAAMRQELGMSESWEGGRAAIKPPYEAWKEINGGVNRIAIADRVDDTTNTPQITEF